MSLLLEALKKAEKAKEEAQRRARDDRSPGEPEELRSEEGAHPPAHSEPQSETRAEPRQALARDDLPDEAGRTGRRGGGRTPEGARASIPRARGRLASRGALAAFRAQA